MNGSTWNLLRWYFWNILRPILFQVIPGDPGKTGFVTRPEYLYIYVNELGEHKDNEKIVKVLACKYEKAEGPEKNHNVDPIYFHVILNQGKEFNCDVPSGHNSFIYLLKGELNIGEKSHIKTADSN